MNSGEQKFLETELNEAHFKHWSWIDIVPTVASSEFQQHFGYFQNWLKNDYHGSMGYLQRGAERRGNPRLLLSSAKAMLCLAIPYRRGPVGNLRAEEGPRWARYIGNGSSGQSTDYHHSILEALEKIFVRAKSTYPNLEYKITVDSSAVLERTWAALSGLGWIGKNKCLIHKELGSYIYLAEVLVNFETGMGPRPTKNLCGNCTKCLTACPTKAFTVDTSRIAALNSNRCISYLTLEFRGDEKEISTELKSQMGSWIAGCDICQEVCPFNFKPVKNEAELDSRIEKDPEQKHENIWPNDWKFWISEQPEYYKKRVAMTAMSRVKPEQMKRNLFIAFKKRKQSRDQG